MVLSIVSQVLAAALVLSSGASAGKTTSVSNWGDNPSHLPAMLVYTPNTIAPKPAIILALHPCGGSGQEYMSLTDLPAYAEKLGYVMLFPTSNPQGGFNCWDCNTEKSLTHNGGGDSEGLAAQVAWALKTYDGDPSKVFVVGDSSGAMMANVMAATYPEVFAGAASYSGVPAACWAGAPESTPFSSDLSCPMGQKAAEYSAKKWGDLARACYPGYNGTRPKMMIVHGTADPAVVISLLRAQLEQWSNVLGLTWTRNVSNDPLQNWKKIVYGDGTQLVGYEVQGAGHMPPFQVPTTLEFFDLMS